MSGCIELAATYRESIVAVVDTKKAIIVAFFFTYLTYTGAIFCKHVLRECDQEKHEKLYALS